MAVLGVKNDFNRDPRKLMATSAIDSRIGWVQQVSTAVFSDDTSFWNNTLITPNTSAIVDNQEKTILNVTSSSGFLTHVVCPAKTQAQGTTRVILKITIDGLLTTIVLNTSGWNANNLTSLNRIVLGTVLRSNDADISAAGRYEGNPLAPMAYSGPANSGHQNFNTTHDWVQQYANRFVLVHPQMLKTHYPQACVRFEDSLNITITTTFAQSNTTQENSGVIYVLDYPSS